MSQASKLPRLNVGDPVPCVLTRAELADQLGISVGRLDELRKACSHPAIREVLPRVGWPRFSGAAFQSWIEQRQHEPKFFKRARGR